MAWIERISEKIKRRIPQIAEDTDGESHMLDLIDNALYQIVDTANADEFERRWDNLLVDCVVALYNYEGMEGSKSRNSNGVSDTYDSSVILAPLLASGVTPYIRPIGYSFSKTRFDYPE